MFTTEEAIRKALGDTLPQDWVDFAALQSERTRAEFVEALAAEFGRVMQNVDLAEIADHVLDGRTIEVSAQIRFSAREAPRIDAAAGGRPELSVAVDSSSEGGTPARGKHQAKPGRAKSERAKGKA